ncbi:helix-turn-helix domain-containing protein [Shimia aestuarii]|uniref:Helix-turn-helix domain-containing protein n=1 Tax=Shimia aestuarii TaxID=254406 RepID=A0A1I4NMB0_9RHOB|nr:helix-turn-helix domain-containing protein [Shimia aestuarii]SFM16629.1 Helix-turn-helix domain-containing protein [Shimia aestuarii]
MPDTIQDASHLLTTRQAADRLSVHPDTLKKGRAGEGAFAQLDYVRLGRAIRYRSSDIDRLVEGGAA